jgi:L-lactate dehydrogenase complex protein LldG
MTADTVERFAASLADVAVDLIRTDAAGFGSALADIATEPVVGAELPYADISLADVEGMDIVCDPTLAELRASRTGVTPAAFGIADYGSVVLRADDPPLTEPASLFVDNHVAVLAASDVLADMSTAVSELGPVCREEGGSAIVATGPSATADMGELVRGAHGPKAVDVLLLTDR